MVTKTPNKINPNILFVTSMVTRSKSIILILISVLTKMTVLIKKSITVLEIEHKQKQSTNILYYNQEKNRAVKKNTAIDIDKYNKIGYK